MDAIAVSVSIGRPREEVFEYLADIANHPEFTDHYLVDWHLTREDSCGRGAGARFRIKAPANRFSWADVTLVEVEAPRLIVEAGSGGKANRIGLLAVYELSPGPGGTTRVQTTIQTTPALLSDRIMESLGARRWLRRQAHRSLRRLRSILEEDHDRGRHATIAAR